MTQWKHIFSISTFGYMFFKRCFCIVITICLDLVEMGTRHSHHGLPGFLRGFFDLKLVHVASRGPDLPDQVTQTEADPEGSSNKRPHFQVSQAMTLTSLAISYEFILHEIGQNSFVWTRSAWRSEKKLTLIQEDLQTRGHTPMPLQRTEDHNAPAHPPPPLYMILDIKMIVET